ncbi:hypothetical protein DBR42_27570 [Pelomonas sp. HMWF004]|nr:hypothetical protein DBR42_27570 [Pelomonas sp. HMWF004]
MKLHSLYLSLWGHPNELSGPFSFETRAACNYVQRYARTLKIDTSGFNRIVIHDDPFPSRTPQACIRGEKALVVPFDFDSSRYIGAAANQKQAYFCELLRHGLVGAAQFGLLHHVELLAKVDEFENNGYVNRWVHASRSIRRHGCTAELLCEMNLEAFTLTLELHRAANDPLRIPLLTTKPDELLFHNEFKGLEIHGDHLVITKRGSVGSELLRLWLPGFMAGEPVLDAETA